MKLDNIDLQKVKQAEVNFKAMEERLLNVDLETLYQLDIAWLSSVALHTKHNVARRCVD